MSINPRRRILAYTLLEIMLGVTIFSLVSAAVGSAYLFGLRSFQALSNYSTLEARNRSAIDLMTRELRSAQTISSYNTALNRKLTFVDGNYKTISYTFDPYAGTLTRTSNNVNKVLLRDCDLINFNLGTRAVSSKSGPSLRHSTLVSLNTSASEAAPSPATARRASRPPRIFGA